MRLLVYGGTFDPPHIGHMGLLKNAIKTAKPDEVVVIPSAAPPHKEAGHTPAWLRMEMCECFLPLFSGLVISDIEIGRGGKSYTVDTLETLQSENPEGEIFLAIGGDMLTSFTKWMRWQDVLKIAVLVAQNRGECPWEIGAAVDALRAAGGRVLITDADVPLVSSTAIREGVRLGEDVFSLIPPPADRIVRENKLYL